METLHDGERALPVLAVGLRLASVFWPVGPTPDFRVSCEGEEQ
jgi:hypothetical protein